MPKRENYIYEIGLQYIHIYIQQKREEEIFYKMRKIKGISEKKSQGKKYMKGLLGTYNSNN